MGVAAVIVAYWLVLPAVVLGLIGVILGVNARRRAAPGGRGHDVATVAVCSELLRCCSRRPAWAT